MLPVLSCQYGLLRRDLEQRPSIRHSQDMSQAQKLSDQPDDYPRSRSEAVWNSLINLPELSGHLDYSPANER